MRFAGTSRTLLAALVACVLATLPAPASAHGGVVEENDLCVINIGYLRAHFKIYVPEQSGHRDYCEDIPIRGDSVFIMEYQHDGLSAAEIDFRIIENVTGKGQFARLEDVDRIADLDAVTVRYEPPTVVPDVFMLRQGFESDGEFIGIVNATPADGGRTYTAVFPFEVGYTGLGPWPWIVGAVFLLQLNYWLMSRRRAAAAAVLFLGITATVGVEAEEFSSRNGSFVVSATSELDPLTINRIHAWTIEVRDNSGQTVDEATIEIDGGMPEHNHGLPTRPRVVENSGDGRYLIAGMRFHMRGYWELRLVIDDGRQRDEVTIPLNIE